MMMLMKTYDLGNLPDIIAEMPHDYKFTRMRRRIGFQFIMKFMITYQLTALRKVSGPLTVMKMDLQDLDF